VAVRGCGFCGGPLLVPGEPGCRDSFTGAPGLAHGPRRPWSCETKGQATAGAGADWGKHCLPAPAGACTGRWPVLPLHRPQPLRAAVRTGGVAATGVGAIGSSRNWRRWPPRWSATAVGSSRPLCGICTTASSFPPPPVSFHSAEVPRTKGVFPAPALSSIAVFSLPPANIGGVGGLGGRGR